MTEGESFLLFRDFSMIQYESWNFLPYSASKLAHATREKLVSHVKVHHSTPEQMLKSLVLHRRSKSEISALRCKGPLVEKWQVTMGSSLSIRPSLIRLSIHVCFIFWFLSLAILCFLNSLRMWKIACCFREAFNPAANVLCSQTSANIM